MVVCVYYMVTYLRGRRKEWRRHGGWLDESVQGRTTKEICWVIYSTWKLALTTLRAAAFCSARALLASSSRCLASSRSSSKMSAGISTKNDLMTSKAKDFQHYGVLTLLIFWTLGSKVGGQRRHMQSLWRNVACWRHWRQHALCQLNVLTPTLPSRGSGLKLIKYILKYSQTLLPLYTLFGGASFLGISQPKGFSHTFSGAAVPSSCARAVKCENGNICAPARIPR